MSLHGVANVTTNERATPNATSVATEFWEYRWTRALRQLLGSFPNSPVFSGRGRCACPEASRRWAVWAGSWPCVFWPAGSSATSVSGMVSERVSGNIYNLTANPFLLLFPVSSHGVLHGHVPVCDAADSTHQRVTLPGAFDIIYFYLNSSFEDLANLEVSAATHYNSWQGVTIGLHHLTSGDSSDAVAPVLDCLFLLDAHFAGCWYTSNNTC